MHASAPCGINFTEALPIGLVAVTVRIAAMADLSEKAGGFDAGHGPNDRTGADAQQLCDALEPGITLSGLSVVMIEQCCPDGPVVVLEPRGQIDRFQAEEYVERANVHVIVSPGGAPRIASLAHLTSAFTGSCRWAYARGNHRKQALLEPTKLHTT
jgi:hypothetical protein